MVTELTLGWITVLNAGLGITVALIVIGSLDRWGADVAAILGIIAAGIVIAGQTYAGEFLLTPTLEGMKLMVVAAVIGGVFGATSTFAIVEPENS